MRRWIVPIALLALAGCAEMQPRDEIVLDAEVVDAEEAPPPEATLLYQLLRAEFAGNRGDMGQAAEAYVAAARVSDDPAVAERATRIALYAERPKLARVAAERWLELEPEADDASQALGVLYLREGQPERAVERFVAAMPPAGPAREETLLRVAEVLAQQPNQEMALAVMGQLAERFPQARAAQYGLAQVALVSGEPAVAVAATERALALSPGWRSAALLRVDALIAADRPKAAVASLEALLAQQPDDYDLNLQYARTLINANRPREALAQFKRLLERQPDDVRVLQAASLLALELRELELARGWLQGLLALGEHTDAAHFFLGRIAELEGDYGKAIDLYSRAGGEYRSQAQLRIAIALAGSGDVDGALERLAALRENAPQGAVQTYAVAGEILRGAGRMGDSIAAYTKGLTLEPANTDLLYGRAMTYVLMDRIAEAEADLRAILERNPDDAHALNALGYTLADRTGRIQEAQRLVERAYELMPFDPAIIDSMGWVQYRLGHLEQAVEYLRRAYEIGGGAEIAAHYGEVLWQLGRHDRARAVWAEALAADPGNPILLRVLERFGL